MPAQKVVVTGAAGQIGYSILPLIARGNLLGPDQHIELHLLEVEPAMKALKGVEAELHDCAFPLLDKIMLTSDARVAFKGAHIAILCGSFPRKPGMERADLLQTNSKIFSAQGAAIAEVADSNIRVLVVGNPANTNALILLKATNGKVKPENITAMTRLDHNRSLSQIALHANVPVASVRNAIIWGNHSSTQVPDIESATVDGKPAISFIKDSFVSDGSFVKKVQTRGAEIIELRGLSSAMSAAKAAVDHVHDWVLGTPQGTYVSMAVLSTGNPYGIPSDLIFSFPCTCKDGKWTIVPNLKHTEDVKKRIAATVAELQEEKSLAGVK